MESDVMLFLEQYYCKVIIRRDESNVEFLYGKVSLFSIEQLFNVVKETRAFNLYEEQTARLRHVVLQGLPSQFHTFV
jgi:hypothetical protein